MLRKLFGKRSSDPEPPPPSLGVDLAKTDGGPDSTTELEPADSPVLPTSEPTSARRSFDLVQEAEAKAAAGDFEAAERLFRNATPRDLPGNSSSGTDYALGRYGSFLEDRDRVEEAISVYETAVRLDTDIPAIFGSLMTLYAERGDEDSLFGTADRYADVPRVEGPRVLAALIRLATNRAKAGYADEAERWLLRTEGWAVRHGDHAGRFAAWGQRGLIVERAGDAARAFEIYEAAVAAGSTDRTTYTRLLMAYEKTKRWHEGLALAQHALGIQHDAAWEEDLRKRIDRLTAKRDGSGPAKRGTRGTIPAFSVRRGGDQLRLVAQVPVKGGAAQLALALGGRHVFISSASSKPENLALYDLETNTPLWTASVPRASADVLACGPARFVAATDQGRVGDGSAQLVWFDAEGTTLHIVELPDKLTEVRAAGDCLVAGCRDGYLYAFDAVGRAKWKFQVPHRDDLQDDLPTSRPCPYFVQIAADGKRIFFSSWNTVYMLDDGGKLLWTWKVPKRSTSYRFTVPLDGQAQSAHYYNVLGLRAPASVEEVRTAFHQRALRTHPDLHPDNPLASEQFREAVQAYEAILSGAAGRRPTRESTVIEVTMTDSSATIYGLAVADRSGESVVSGSDGVLTYLDAFGRPKHRLFAREGAGGLVGTPDLARVVYAHWFGLNFYGSEGLVGIYPLDWLGQMRLSPDGRFLVTWRGKTLLLLTTVGELVTEIEFARTITDAVFAGLELMVVAGKLIRLSYHQPALRG